MPNFPSIKTNERLAEVLGKFNTGVERPLMEMHEVLMRSDDSPFSKAERELIAAYVSGVNDCSYCINTHKLVAIRFGIEEGLFERLMEDPDSSGVNDKLKPVLKYVKKLTLTPYKMSKSDTEAILNAGWTERAVYDAMLICCTWNFMNRFVEATGLEIDDEQQQASAEMLSKGYTPIIDKFNLK
jgi:uncharacterized peroxidase-related enzyme